MEMKGDQVSDLNQKRRMKLKGNNKHAALSHKKNNKKQ